MGAQPEDTDPLLGFMETPDLAARVVAAMNREQSEDTPSRVSGLTVEAVEEWLCSPGTLAIASEAWRRNVPGSQGENILADVLTALAAAFKQTEDTYTEEPK